MTAVGPGSDGPARPGLRAAPALGIVQHGHQYLITNGYDNREGISEIVDAFTTVLALHLRYDVPLNLHLSGTLIEAIAWHDPEFFGWVRALHREGLLEFIGSAYSQNIMATSSAGHNARQIDEALRLYQRHLGIEPEDVRGFWVPERVWDTRLLAPLLRRDDLLNGGYDYVLLDDRLAYPLSGERSRREFDAGSAPSLGRHSGESGEPSGNGSRDHLTPWRIEGGEGLVAVPFSSDLRYSVPPHHPSQMAGVAATLRRADRAGSGAIAVYADDLEKSSGVGPWTGRPWTRPEVDAYERLLEWVATSGEAAATRLSPWLRAHPPSCSRPVDRGTFFELAHLMGAGEDYRTWWDDPEWAPYRTLLERAEGALAGLAPGDPGADPLTDAGSLAELGWKQLMAASYETGWHQVEAGGVPSPAPWAKAVTAHARSVFVIAAAAAWQRSVVDRASSRVDPAAGRALRIEVTDLDDDGEPEVILANRSLFAVVSPRHGGRLVYLFDLAGPGRLVVGNPADDWNWQEEANQFMRVPRNHPGGFADVGHENDAWQVDAVWSGDDGVFVQLLNVEPGSSIAGATKTFHLAGDRPVLGASYHLPDVPERFLVDFALSPDYLSLLRQGRAAVRPMGINGTRGWRSGPSAVWLRLPGNQPVLWDRPLPDCGHAFMLRVAAWRASFSFELGLTARLAFPGEATDSDDAEVRRLTLVPAAADPAATGSEGLGR